MSRALTLGVIVVLLQGCTSVNLDGLLDELEAGMPRRENKIRDALKEALTIGIDKAVTITSREDGYFRHAEIHIPLPEQLDKFERVLRPMGYGPKIDEFVLSMNRAAERAAPAAKQIFVDAIVQMNFEDARAILDGSDTAATEFLRAKTSAQLSDAFRPMVTRAMDDYTVTRQYKTIADRYNAVPLVKDINLISIEEYTVGRALDGLFFVLGEQERLIRTEPSARVTKLLREVFGN